MPHIAGGSAFFVRPRRAFYIYEDLDCHYVDHTVASGLRAKARQQKIPDNFSSL